MAQLNFNFEQPFDEIDINGHIYKLYYDDESLKRYQKLATDYQQDAEKYAQKQNDLGNMSEKEIEKLEQEGVEFLKRFTDGFFGEGAFEPIYEASGRSTLNFMPLIEYTLDWLNNKMPDTDQAKKDYYLKK
ncbi:hypothetical protein [Alkalibacillus almallahensis]|uniref:hypothetical protein n=1 Tax=Alkalibacillus almallahensis TaxID=1379154 RepID=UPI00141E1D1D|nr:hypothetical protein [Alkalibacillus almallahensis]NIK12875.1 uncharacterized membrane protein (DUF106 family) [Alkalibacillus almallahensis]